MGRGERAGQGACRHGEQEADADAEAVRENLAVLDLAIAERLKELEWLRPTLIDAVVSQQQRPSPTSPQKFDQNLCEML